MSNVIRLVKGDDLPGISFFIRDSNQAAVGKVLDRKDPSTWRPVDITGCALSGAVAQAGENVQIDTVSVVPVDSVVGEVLVTLNDCTFLDAAGTYDCEITVQFPEGQQTVYDMLTFDVRERINASSSN